MSKTFTPTRFVGPGVKPQLRHEQGAYVQVLVQDERNIRRCSVCKLSDLLCVGHGQYNQIELPTPEMDFA